MAYDDVVAKLLTTLEHSSLNVKITAGTLSDRYRSQEPVESRIYILAERTLTYFKNLASVIDEPIRFNRATMLTWLLFFARILRSVADSEFEQAFYARYVFWFELTRSRYHKHAAVELPSSIELRSSEFELFNLFNDRSTARAADVSSVIYRDFIAFYFAYRFLGKPTIDAPLADSRVQMILGIEEQLLGLSLGGTLEGLLEAQLDFRGWGELK
jgi:hypothetical protein